MFKDLTHLADPNDKEVKSINKQAYLHGELKSLLAVMHDNIDIRDLNQLKEEAISQVKEAFEYNCTKAPTEVELNRLIKVNSNYNRSVSFTFTKDYELNRSIHIDEKFKDLQFDLGRGIRRIVSSIAMKEKYIEYVLNDSEANRKEVKLKDTIVYANNKIESHLRDAETYNLRYESTKEREGKLGFTKQVLGYTDNGVKFIPEIIVDHNWCDKVYAKGLMLLEYQGARAFTISCEFLSRSKDCDLYSTQVLQITGTRDEKNLANSTWGHTNWDAISTLFKVKDLVLAIPDNNRNHMALGQDAAWAERTMRRRQKMDMMKQLDL